MYVCFCISLMQCDTHIIIDCMYRIWHKKMQTFEIFTFNRAINCQTYFFPQQTLRSIQNLLCWTISRFVSVQILSSSACSCVSIIGIFSLVGFHKTKQRNMETCVHFININHFLSFFVIHLSNNVVSNYNDRHPVCMLASLIWIFLISFFLSFWLISNSTYSIQFFIHPKPS